MNVGDYARTKYGIEKITDIKEWVNFQGYEKIITTDKNQYETLYEQSEIIKSSPNLIDLIEVGDYVNGLYVHGITDYGLEVYMFGDAKECLKEDEIKTIVTKEQFKNMEYEVE